MDVKGVLGGLTAIEVAKVLTKAANVALTDYEPDQKIDNPIGLIQDLLTDLWNEAND